MAAEARPAPAPSRFDQPAAQLPGHRRRIDRARNDLLFDAEGRRYIDLFSAHGATWLGHSRPAIAERVAAQLERVWLTGSLETEVFLEARQRVEGFFPASHRLAGLYSTGMEAAELALRIARVSTGRIGVVGFERSLHGKSLATAYLGWDNRDGIELPFLHRLPFVSAAKEDEILGRLEAALAGEPVSAVFVEPLQGSGGGWSASPEFYRAVRQLCSAHGSLLVFDEILTGFHRTGFPFFYESLGVVPDVVLVGKALGNGFPVSGVLVDERYPLLREMLPGSTYAGNPLAAAAVSATLEEMGRLDLPAAVARMERTITAHLEQLAGTGIAVRGRGALWVAELPAGMDLEAAVPRIWERGVSVGYTGQQLRILPPATIEPAHLETACAVVTEELLRAAGAGS